MSHRLNQVFQKSIQPRPSSATGSMARSVSASSVAAVVRPVKATMVKKPIVPTIKPSTSQNNVKKIPILQPKPIAPPSIAQSKKDPPSANVVQHEAEFDDDDEDLAPQPRIRSGSYTISRSESQALTPNIDSAPDRNVVERPTSSDSISTPTGNRFALTENDFETSIGKMVSANGQQGVLRYFGPVQHLHGQFCGIEFDKPIGLNDGSIDGRRYFQARFKCGTFAPMELVQILDRDGASTSTAVSQQIQKSAWPSDDGELLTDVEPDLLERTLDDSMMASSVATFDLSSSLSFLKGSRFPGMDISMTPSELAAQLQIGETTTTRTETERESLFEIEGADLLIDYGQNSGVNTVLYSNGGLNSENAMAKFKTINGQQKSTADYFQTTPTLANSSFPESEGRQVYSVSQTAATRPNAASLDNKKVSPSVDVVSKFVSSPNQSRFQNSNHNSKGFEAFAVLISHYAQKIVPGLQDELAAAKKTIGELTTIKSNQENENRSLREDFQSQIDQQRNQYEARIQRMKSDFQKQMAENTEFYKKAIEDQKSAMARQAKSIQLFKEQIRQSEKTIKDNAAEIESLRSVTEMRSNELRDLQTKSNDFEKMSDELAKVKTQAKLLETRNIDLANTIEKKTAVEIESQQTIAQLRATIEKEDARNRSLRMKKEEVDFRLKEAEAKLLSQSLYATPASQIGSTSYYMDASLGSSPAFTKSKKTRRSRSMIGVGKTE